MEESIGGVAADLLAFPARLAGTRAYRYLLRALKERQPPDCRADIHLVAPDYVDANPAERPVVERIFAAFCRAKEDQQKADAHLLPEGGWKKVLETSYAPLLCSWKENDLDLFHQFLTNFGAWHEPTGITESYLLRGIRHSPRRQLHFEQREMANAIHWWTMFESQGRQLDALSMPRFGNQCGVTVDGHFLSTDAVASDVDSRVIAGLVSDCPRPQLAELGGGYGRLVHFLSRHISTFRYLGFDLPECICCASYYLMLAFPEKRFLLYGEADWDSDVANEYDFVLLPSFELAKLPDQSVDLFLNENSLGVMLPDTCRYFVGEMCRGSRGIWHRNHEIRRNHLPQGNTTLVNSEYPIPKHDFIQRLRFPDVRRFIVGQSWTLDNDMYWYYFQRNVKL
ncbi:MAG: putative sugar O-methyltransferase [Pirellulaceae bacterium]